MTRTRAQGRRREAAVAVAVAVSIAAHATLVAVLLRLRPEPGPSAHGLEVTLVEVPRPASPGETSSPTVPGGREPSSPAAGPRPPAALEASPATPPPAGRAGPSELSGPSGASDPAGASRAPRSSGPGSAIAWLRGNGLAPRASPGALATPVPRELRPVPSDPRRETDQVFSDLVATMRAADLARYPDASWMDLRDRLAKGFAPGFDALEESGRGGASSFLADAAAAYAASAARYGASGRPFENGPGAPGRAAASKDAVARAGAAGNRERESLLGGLATPFTSGDAEGVAAGWTKRLVTVVAVDQDGAGLVCGARILAPSGSRSHDRLALAQALRLRGQAVGARLASSTTEWIFVTDFSVVPPVPVVGIGFDAHFKPTGAVYPLKRTTRTKVQLVAVRRAS